MMLHPYTSRVHAEARADRESERTGVEHTLIECPRCLRSSVETAWYVLGPRTRPPRPVDYPLYGTNRPETWASDVLQALRDPRREVDPKDLARWEGLLEPRRSGPTTPESKRPTVQLKLRVSSEHRRRLDALAAGDPLSATVERLIDLAWEKGE